MAVEDLFKAEFQTHDPEAKWINGESSWPCEAPAEEELKQALALFSHQPKHLIVIEMAAVDPLDATRRRLPFAMTERVAAIIALELFSRLSDEPVTGCDSHRVCVFPPTHLK